MVVLISVGYMLSGVVLYVLMGSGRITLVVLAAMVGFYVPHYLNLSAALRGERPKHMVALLVIQALATYLPNLGLVGGWSQGAGALFAGPLLLLVPLRWSAPIVGLTALWHMVRLAEMTGSFSVGLYYGLTIVITGGMIYSLVRLVRVTVELEQARADLAEAAVLKERLRISRDLHDGLGRSLTAIALKGDLASRLMDRDPGAARNEVGELVQVAREAAQDVRLVARGYREMSLAGEVHRAVALLETSGVDCQVNLAETALPRDSEETLAWGVREGVTNVLRHSRATICTISTSVRGGAVHLEVVNDGAPAAGPPANSGGLTGLGERAAQAGGSVTAGGTDGGGFRLVMEVPA